MKKIVFSIFLGAFAIILAGCSKDIPVVDNQDSRPIVIFLSTKSTSSSFLKSSAGDGEEDIDYVILYHVNQSEDILDITEIDGPNLEGEQIYIAGQVKTIYAIANPSDDFKLAIPPTTVSELMELTEVFSTLPTTPLLMSGKGTVTSFSANIVLVRAVAKIDFVGTDFTIKSITVSNTPKEGYVFKKEPLEIPVSGKGSYQKIDFLPLVIETTLYLPENIKENPTEFVVEGLFMGNPLTYTFSLKSGGEDIDIVRNTRYMVSISPVSGGVTFSMPAWDDVITDPVTNELPNPYLKGIKILAIGNSYAQNSMQYMYSLLRQLNVTGDIILVVASQDGASLEDHVDNVENEDYTNLDKITYTLNGSSVTQEGEFSLEEIIKSEKWDVITLQQSSPWSGVPSAYDPYLGFLITYVDNIMNDSNNPNNNPSYRFGWHMTWAYTQGYFDNPLNISWLVPRYGNPRGMYEAICNTVKQKIVNNNAFNFIIPTGTAIQNARVYFNDNLYLSDGVHLSSLGRYLAATMWIKKITGLDISKLTVPYPMYDTTISVNDFETILQAVNDAVTKPFESPE